MGDRLFFLFNMPFRVKKNVEKYLSINAQNKMNSNRGAPNNSAQLGNAERKRKFVSYTKRECLYEKNVYCHGPRPRLLPWLAPEGKIYKISFL
jgi:hypothetical protein